jgi:peptidoglycan/xylan/chitin deacetylase (PgdA/CDA1 family)
MSCDDGCSSDIRVAELAKKYGVECVFYWPVEWHSLAYDNGYDPLRYDEALEIAQNFEIGSHTITHRHLTKIDETSAYREIWQSQIMLERLFKVPVNKFCPPRGYTNEDLTEFTLEHYDSQRLTKGKGLVHVHPNSGANNNMDWREYAKTIDVKELWFHSWELDKYDLWEQLEEYLKENV